MNPARRRGTKKKTEATLPRCPQERNGRHFKNTVGIQQRWAPRSFFEDQVKAPSLGGLEARRNFYISFQFSALFCHM